MGAYALAVDERDPEHFGRVFTAAVSLETNEPGIEWPVITYFGTAEIEPLIQLVNCYARTFQFMVNHLLIVEPD